MTYAVKTFYFVIDMPENERLLDHLHRREFARQNFPAATPPYFDDRGKYYVKYGKPVVRFEDPGGPRRVSFFSSANYRAIQGQYSYKGGPEEHYTAMANESWAYPNVARDLVVHFVKDGPTYREIESLTEALASHQRKNLSWQWSDLIKQRAAISPFLGQMAQQIERSESAVISVEANPQRLGLLRVELQSLSERLLEVERAGEDEAGKVRRNLPATTSEPVKAVNRLAFQETIAQFRGANGHTRVEITFMAPLKKNFVDQLDSLTSDTIAVEFAWMLRDGNLDSLATKRWENIFPNESWSYENVARDFLVHFVKEGSVYREIEDLTMIMIAGRRIAPEKRAAQWGALAIKRAAVSPVLGRAAAKIHELAAAAKLPNAVGKLTVTAQPGESELTLQIKDVRQDKLGFTRQAVSIRDFRSHDLMISDIQFLTEAANADQRQILPVFTKLNTSVAPYPFEKIQKTIPLLCYFEIYNLKSSGIPDNYEVVYKVISEKGGDKNIAVSVSYIRPVTDDTAPELIGIDLHKVPKGAHRLEITVTGMNNRNITASVQKEIWIED